MTWQAKSSKHKRIQPWLARFENQKPHFVATYFRLAGTDMSSAPRSSKVGATNPNFSNKGVCNTIGITHAVRLPPYTQPVSSPVAYWYCWSFRLASWPKMMWSGPLHLDAHGTPRVRGQEVYCVLSWSSDWLADGAVSTFRICKAQSFLNCFCTQVWQHDAPVSHTFVYVTHANIWCQCSSSGCYKHVCELHCIKLLILTLCRLRHYNQQFFFLRIISILL